MLCFTKIPIAKNFMDRRRGVSRFPVEKFLSHKAENFRRGSLFVSINPSIEKVWARGGEEYQKFSLKILCLTVPKVSVGGEPFSVSLISGIEKVCVRGGEEYQKFSSKVICLTVPKISLGVNLLVFHDFRVSKKFML